MKRKLSWMLCICLCVLFLAACGADPRDVDYNGFSYDQLESYAEQTWQGIQSVPMEQAQGLVDQLDAMSERELKAVMESYEGMDQQYTMFKGWVSIADQLGEYQGLGDFSVTKSGKTTTTELELKFSQRPAVLTVVYENLTMDVETVTIDLVYSTGEKMGKAALNTLMGMGTVFVMLILISLIISCFRVIPVLEKKAAQRKEQKLAGQSKEMQVLLETPVMQQPVQETDDLELVAVIAAAIAAATGQSADDFVVRSIKRR